MRASPPSIQPAAPQVDLAFVDQAVARIGRRAEDTIPLLQAIQEHYGYLPERALEHLCRISDITPASVVGVGTFYSQFRHAPAGRHIVRVCHGTACHVKGSQRVHDAIARHLKIPQDANGGVDTDPTGTFTVERVACLGCCTLAPVVQVGLTTFGHATAETAPQMLDEALDAASNTRTPRKQSRGRVAAGKRAGTIRIGVGSCCVAGGSMRVKEALEAAVASGGVDANIKTVGCVGMCHQTPLVEVSTGDGGPARLYFKVSAPEAAGIVRANFRPRGLFGRLASRAMGAIDALLSDDAREALSRHPADVRDAPVCSFLGSQVRIATESCGELDPLDLDEYLAHDGFVALKRALGANAETGLSPAQLIELVSASGLRGRGGAGFPTGRKWAAVAAAQGSPKYVIANGDEGDPGAFMDRMILESYPYRELEGMTLAALAVGAQEGVLYIRDEYPLAVRRIIEAIGILESRGYLGDNILSSGRSLHLRVVRGAGAFVCGEETALLASIEGRRGTPRLRPPFPAQSGLWGKPTCINNVETYAMIPWIVRHGPQAFAAIGTDKSKGTKVFALTGKVRRGGLIEVPMGISLRRIVEEIGGGVPDGRRFKAVQIGGPSGGCVPAEMADIGVDYESLTAAGAIMGSGGLVVMDDADCMVDIARYFLHFTQIESCGKCTFCRVGTRAMLDILDRLCEGRGKSGDIQRLEELATNVKRASVCGLGTTAPNPILSTLRYFRDEYEAHLQGRCPAGRCKALVRYAVTDACIGCTRCAQECPTGAIAPRPYAMHEVEDSKCIRCDVCRTTCPTQAIVIR